MSPAAVLLLIFPLVLSLEVVAAPREQCSDVCREKLGDRYDYCDHRGGLMCLCYHTPYKTEWEVESLKLRVRALEEVVASLEMLRHPASGAVHDVADGIRAAFYDGRKDLTPFKVDYEEKKAEEEHRRQQLVRRRLDDYRYMREVLCKEKSALTEEAFIECCATNSSDRPHNIGCNLEYGIPYDYYIVNSGVVVIDFEPFKIPCHCEL